MARYLVTIIGKGREAMADLVREYHVDVLRHTTRALEEGRHQVDAVIEERLERALKKGGYEVERRENIDTLAKERLKDVGQGDRYKFRGPD